MEFHSEESTAKRRKIRKGTHSCQECRKRKVKCILASPTDSTCIMCKRRGARCISQYDALELLDETIPEDADTNDRDITPTAALFPTPESTATSIPSVQTQALPQTHSQIRESLLRALPCRRDIIILSERTSLISAVCYQSDYKSHSGSNKPPKEQIPVTSLLHPEKHPTLLARQMLLFAAAIQHLSPKEEMPGLSQHQHVIMKQLAEAAIKLVNMEDALLGTLEGLENLIFEFFHHLDCGNIRRAWMTTRRAVTAAQILGLHRSADHHRFVLIKNDSDLEPEIM